MSVGSFFHKVANFVHGAEVKVSDLFVKLFGQDIAQKFAHDSMLVLKSALGQIVVKVVTEIETNGASLTGDQKRSQAIDAILAEAKTAGLDAGKQVVSMLIELAVAGMRKEFVPA